MLGNESVSQSDVRLTVLINSLVIGEGKEVLSCLNHQCEFIIEGIDNLIHGTWDSFQDSSLIILLLLDLDFVVCRVDPILTCTVIFHVGGFHHVTEFFLQLSVLVCEVLVKEIVHVCEGELSFIHVKNHEHHSTQDSDNLFNGTIDESLKDYSTAFLADVS